LVNSYTASMADSSIPDGRSSPVEMEAPFEVATPSKTGINPQAVENVIYSDVGLILPHREVQTC